ncbi:MAG: SufE family protein [Flavobacteriales bacterium]|nr:SufE family protein [Flavobacteriales bacterium]
MAQSINEIQDEVIDEFSFFGDWMEKYEHIIEFGKGLPPIDVAYKVEENLVKGCQSQVWLNAERKGNTLHFTADSDAIITKGLVGLMVRVLSDQTTEDIAKADLYFVDRIGLKEHLSPNRANGLVSMIKKMKMFAIAHQAKSEQ